MIKASQIRLAQTASTPPVEAEILNILTLVDFKEESRILHSAEDRRLTEAIKEAYYRLDGPFGWLNRAILEQTWVGVCDELDDEIELPVPPLQSVTQVRYMDEDGAWQTLSTSLYGVETKGLFGRVYRKKDQEYPDIHTDPGSVEVTFVAGWGDGAEVLAAVPLMRKALKLLAGHYYYNPLPTFIEPRLVEVPRKIQYGLEHTIGPLRIMNDPS